MKYLRLLGYIIAASFLVNFTASFWNWFGDSTILPQLGLVVGIPLGYAVWKREEKRRKVAAFIQAELQEYRQKISKEEIAPGQIIFLRRSDGALVTEWTTGWATVIRGSNGYQLSNHAKDNQGLETYGNTEPGELTMAPRWFQSEEAACQYIVDGWSALDIISPGHLELHWPRNIVRPRRQA